MTIEYNEAGDVEWCSAHHGIRNEDEHRCDMIDVSDGEGDDCVLHALFWTSPVVRTVGYDR